MGDLLSTRVFDTIGMRVGDLMEIIVWGYVERKILSAWFPQIQIGLQESAGSIQNIMRAASKTLIQSKLIHCIVTEFSRNFGP